jgi:transposase-like protein
MNIATREQQILRVQTASFHPQLNAALEKQLRADVVSTVQSTLEAALVEEVEAERAKRVVPPRRSGYYQRVLDTQYGRIPHLNIPKLRARNKDREWQILTRYARNMGGLLAYAGYLYVMGLSLRDLQTAFYFLLGNVLSTTAINRVTLQVQAQLDQERLKKIEKTPVALIVDGVWVSIQYDLDEYKVDKAGHRRRKRHAQERVILCVMAVCVDGSHYVVHYEIAEDEDETTWGIVFAHLIARGLDPQAVKLIVSDGTKGLLAAMAQFLPAAQQQRCITHKVRGMNRYLTYQDLSMVDDAGHALTTDEAKHQRWRQLKTEAYAIYDEPSRPAAQAQLTTFVHKWQALEPQAVHAFQWGVQRTFTFYDFDKELHPLIRTTNALERFFREFRTKADEIGAFPNETSCLTVFLLVVTFDHAKHDRIPVANTS